MVISECIAVNGVIYICFVLRMPFSDTEALKCEYSMLLPYIAVFLFSTFSVYLGLGRAWFNSIET